MGSAVPSAKPAAPRRASTVPLSLSAERDAVPYSALAVPKSGRHRAGCGVRRPASAAPMRRKRAESRSGASVVIPEAGLAGRPLGRSLRECGSTDREPWRRLDSQTHPVAFDREHNDSDIVTDHDAFAQFASYDEHASALRNPRHAAPVRLSRADSWRALSRSGSTLRTGDPDDGREAAITRATRPRAMPSATLFDGRFRPVGGDQRDDAGDRNEENP